MFLGYIHNSLNEKNCIMCRLVPFRPTFKERFIYFIVAPYSNDTIRACNAEIPKSVFKTRPLKDCLNESIILKTFIYTKIIRLQNMVMNLAQLRVVLCAICSLSIMPN